MFIIMIIITIIIIIIMIIIIIKGFISRGGSFDNTSIFHEGLKQ